MTILRMTILRLLLDNHWARGLALGAAVILLVFTLDRCARYAMQSATTSATEAGRQEQRARDLAEEGTSLCRLQRGKDSASKALQFAQIIGAGIGHQGSGGSG